MSKFWDQLAKEHRRLLNELPYDQAVTEINKNYSSADIDTEDSAAELESLAPILHDIHSILEFGAGYGRTAEAILTRKPELKYFIFDIEPALSIAKRYLKDFPQVVFLPVGALLPEPDLTVFSSVLSELDTNEVEDYIEIAGDGKYVYIKDWYQWNDIRHRPITLESYQIPMSWEPIIFRDYPIIKGFFEGLWKVK